MYEERWSRVYYDDVGMSTGYKSENPFIYRWTDTVLTKSTANYFEENFKSNDRNKIHHLLEFFELNFKFKHNFSMKVDVDPDLAS